MIERVRGVLGVVALVLAAAGGAVAGPGCGGPAPRRPDVYVAVSPGDTSADVRRKWGEPTRVLTFRDERTGNEEIVWQYEGSRYPQASPDVMQVVFRDGVVVRVERVLAERYPAKDILRPDSAARRDMQ